MHIQRASQDKIEEYMKQCISAQKEGTEVKIHWNTRARGYPESTFTVGHVSSHNEHMAQVSLETKGGSQIPINLEFATRVEYLSEEEKPQADEKKTQQTQPSEPIKPEDTETRPEPKTPAKPGKSIFPTSGKRS